MKQKPGFTLIEILMVVGLLSILLIAFRPLFQVANKEITYGQTCINYLYGDINNYLNASLTNKGLRNNSGDLFFPDYYKLNFDTDSGNINFQYILEDTSTGTRKTINFNDQIPTSRQCKQFDRTIIISGANIDISIKKGFNQASNLPSFQIKKDGINTFYSSIPFFLCDSNFTCIEMSKIDIDSRAKTISQHNCLRFTGSLKLDCAERN